MSKLPFFTLFFVLCACSPSEIIEHDYNSIDQTPLSEVVKTKIETYVSTNHPNNSVVGVGVEPQVINVKLNSNIEILFSLSGDFTAYDSVNSNDDNNHDDGEYNSIDQAPLSEVVKTKIKTYISTNHPSNSVVEVDIENQTIEIELNNNIEILFSLSGDFIAYDNNSSNDDDHDDGEYNSIDQAPLSEVVKTKIKTYISTNHPNKSIVEVDIENQTIEVELNNNVEILFSLSGDFIAYDDD